MAIVMKLRWEGVTPDQYDKACEIAGWETDVPDGAVFHVAWFGDDGINVLDVWDGPEQFQDFLATRLGAATQAAGMAGEPTVEISPAHRIFDARQATAWS
jgi:hypothetical protein